ncbi:ROK family protein [Photobacterium minamisatsumaniensis]|uniref:ROK family protein n=1 Tax=Photobacterium minamisatsumaniensis TaxID=2910233 RepID=UPI003D0B1742
MMMKQEQLYLAYDIGGTNIKYGVLNQDGKILHKDKVETELNGEAIIDCLVAIKEKYSRRYKFEGAAFSLPGFVNVDTGYMQTGGAIDDFYGINFKDIMTSKLAMPVELENDVNCVALAEKWLGNAIDSENFLCITLGSGVGGAIYFNNQLVRGHRYMAGEFGYMLTRDLFTNQELPATMSFTASVKEGLRRQYVLRKGGLTLEEVSGRDVFSFAKAGDAIAQGVLESFYEHVAIGLYNLTFILNPEKIIIGGAISERREILEKITDKFQNIINHERAIKDTLVSDYVTIESAKFNNDSGLIGAVYHFITMSK